MTTIATDGITMAGDGLITEDGIVTETACRKVLRLPDGRIVGVCGDAYAYEPFITWMSEGGDFPKIEEGFSALTLDPDGVVRTWDKTGRSFIETKVCALGSGKQLALGAMDAGKTPLEAVQIACQRDIYSGGEIIELAVQSARKVAA